jgi:S1-C subfamily serine protease
VPALFVISSSNPEYHTPRDTLDKINYPTMTKVAKMVYLIANSYANLPKRPEVDVAAAMKQRRAGRGYANRPYLGVGFKDTEKGLEVESISENSPAEEAGLKPKDIIVKFKDKEIKNRENLRDIMRDVKVGEDVTLEILRSGEKKTLELTVGRRPRRR